ncbi:TrkA family potassium uptake protein [Leucobacter sp. UCMA 4100]|uniref:potassium channel family protein n=1 Tax=Leucobacter sp. UCMA 4100 TaxID=2810534 RepID=UPI0022EA3495|nr:TrkA family potassium uptake protein [Leucobacter sp. UCMA 4100]MDA3147404.1 TrkA family potassium uptake protein [Leucobacter sp. UCMA 4100]
MVNTRTDYPVLVIGLGRFGAATAGELDRLDHEVLAIEQHPQLVQKWADRITHVVEANATSMEALKQLGADQFGAAVLAVGDSIESSVLIAANLVDLGIPQIWAKAMSHSHGKILERIGVHHVIYPEREAGERVAHLISGAMLDFIEFDENFVIAKLRPPRVIQSLPLSQSQVRTRHKVTITGVKKVGSPFDYATPDTVIDPSDLIIVAGSSQAVEHFSSLD